MIQPVQSQVATVWRNVNYGGTIHNVTHTTDRVMTDSGLTTGMKESMMTPKTTKRLNLEQGIPREFEIA